MHRWFFAALFSAALLVVALPLAASAQAATTLTTDATDAGLPSGTINDVATLDLSNAPAGTTGTIEFKLYGPFAADAEIGADDCVDSGAGANLVFTDEQTVTDFD